MTNPDAPTRANVMHAVLNCIETLFSVAEMTYGEGLCVAGSVLTNLLQQARTDADTEAEREIQHAVEKMILVLQTLKDTPKEQLPQAMHAVAQMLELRTGKMQ